MARTGFKPLNQASAETGSGGTKSFGRDLLGNSKLECSGLYQFLGFRLPRLQLNIYNISRLTYLYSKILFYLFS